MPPKKKAAKKKKKVMGRPTKYDPRFCEAYIEHGKQGGLVEEFPALLHEKFGVAIESDKTIYNWARDHKNFLHAKNIGDAYSKRWWLALGKRQCVKGTTPNFPQGFYVFLCKNKLNWKDKVETEVTGQGGAPFQLVVKDYRRKEKDDGDQD